uniref:Peptidase S1 domain-containing protein n=1 Tax=Podarcis muralis TaxID=64176 RepID=A0A670IA36_PODMU
FYSENERSCEIVLGSLLITRDGCGTRPLIDEKKTGTQIVGDNEAQLGSWPWLVSLQIYRVFQGGYRHRCCGSLISNDLVLTAAHCIKEWVYVSLYFILSILGIMGKMLNSYDNDIALFELIKFVEYDDYIQPICLPDIPLLVTDKNPCYISGWGEKEEKGKSFVSVPSE